MVLPEKKTWKKAYPMKLLNHSPVMTKISLPHLGKPIRKNERSGNLVGRNKWTLLPWCVVKWKRCLPLGMPFQNSPKVPQRKFLKKRSAIRNSPRVKMPRSFVF